METNTTRIPQTQICMICSGSGADPTFGDECAACAGTGHKRTAVSRRSDGATDAQVRFYTSLIGQLLDLSGPADREGAETALLAAFGEADKRRASKMIDTAKDAISTLREAQRAERAEAARAAAMTVEPGLYAVGPEGAEATIVRIQMNRARTNTYGMVLNREAESFEYAAGMVARVAREGRRLSQDEAAAFGQAWGVCACCGRLLTNPESIAIGIGPICRTQF